MSPTCVHSCKGLCNARSAAVRREEEAIAEYRRFAGECDYPDVKLTLDSLVAERERLPKDLWPHLDRLAAEGMRLTACYSAGAVCSPSRSSLLTGTRPDTTKVWDLETHFRKALPDVVTLPQHFKNQGYFTRSLGKIYHVGIDDPASWTVPPWHSKKPRYGAEGSAAVEKRRQAFLDAGEPLPQKGENAPFYGGPAFEAPDLADDDLLDGDTARDPWTGAGPAPEGGGGAGHADGARTARGGDRVGGEAGGVGDVPDVDDLAGQDVGGYEEVFVDRDAALVVHVRFGDDGAMDLAAEHGALHLSCSLGYTPWRVASRSGP